MAKASGATRGNVFEMFKGIQPTAPLRAVAAFADAIMLGKSRASAWLTRRRRAL